MSGKPPCRYFRLPGGCKSGDKCRFSHTNNSGSQFQGRPNSSPNAKMNKTNQKPAFIPGLPRGACRDFWANGSCSRGFTCKHDHVNGPGKPQTSGQQAVESVPSLQTGLDIYSEQATNSPGKSPGEVQITLKNFMVSNFSGFRSSSQVYLFLECINSARVSNTSWKASDAQTLLDALVSTNHGEGLLRLGEIVQRPCEPSIMNSWSFIRGTLPVLEYMASEWVSKSTIAHNVNALYGILHQNFKQMQDTIERFVPTMMTARSFRDTGGITISGSHLFKAIFVAFFEYTRRYKDALEANLGMRDLIKQLADWFYVWEAAFESSLPFDDPLGKKEPRERRFVLSEIRKVVESLLSVVGRARAIVIHQSDTQGQTAQDILKYRNEAIIASLFREYQGPGTHREGGPRHDNDRVDIQDIRIAPTQDELLCTIDPYLPANIAGAPHQYPTESVQRLLDVQFRLLREELVAPIRSAIQLVAKDLTQPIHIKTQLKELMKSKGGRYRSPSDAQDSVIFSIFTNVGFGPFEMDKRGSSVGILMDTPPGDARNPNPRQRTAYWETASKKRLMQGGLVALILKDGAKPLEVFTGLISSNSMELKESAQNNPSRIGVRVSFFDAEIELRIVRELQEQRANTPRMRLLLECPVLYESIQPFLTALQMMPEVLPFADYLRHHGPGYLSRLPITPPLYAQRPGFSFELKSLLDDPAESLRLDANDLRSVTHARQELIKSSRLDKSQAEAMIDVMTREISLIQGPPGTGKSYTGVEIIRVLVQNAVTPIILMAFTNHALDHMLLKLLEQNITSNIVRLGSRSSDERISQFSLSNLTRDLPDLKRTIGHKWGAMKDTEEEMKKLMNAMVKKQVPRQSMNDSVLIDSPEHYDNIFGPPPWIDSIYKDLTIEKDGWSKSDRTKRGKPSKLEFWRDAHDLTRLEPPNPPPAKATNNAASANRYEGLVENPEISHRHKLQAHRAQLLSFLRMHGVTSVPSIPTSRRSLEVLRKDSSVWAMSISERKELYYYWKAIALEQMGDSRLSDFKRLRDDHAETRQQYQNIQDQAQVNLLKKAAVVGCTTTGAAKLVSLLAGMEPRVMVVEEAGQVLEAHVLATLVPSISQVIMIGDPRQLRPNLVNYKLSVDNHQTGKIYRFDQSLMERLSDSGLHMSRLDVQRRMRPSISSLIRNTLYEGLVDNPCVTTYPDVRGMSQNVYFLSHSNMESGGGDDSVSKHNEFEVNMIHALVKHLLRQGCYGATGSIVVLSAYLGQIPKIHARLKGEITTIVDERDANKLAEQGIETDLATVEQVEVSKKVLIRTLDNFQGEEGDIIILSLVRNAGTAFVKDVSNLEFDKNIRSSVGFLKSINRTNVGLSRAKHGLYMLGNAPELAVASKMWATVLQELDSSDSIGTGFPIACHQHPEYVRFIKKPEMFAIHAPDGGCLQPCNSRLSCGHACPYKCHSDDPDHVAIKCQAPCPKLCPLLHPCRKLCFESCGNCEFPSQNVALLCGHILENATCHDSRHVEEVVCRKLVEKRLLYCEHYAVMPCHQDPSAWICRAPCGKSLDCCGRPCSSSCGGCMQRSSPLEPKQTDRVIGQVTRSAHPGHKCDKDLRCGHRCMETCAKEHLCSGNCHSPCRQVCSHHKCNKRCCDPCAPCMESCSWECPHQACPLTCGSPCSRLPCDEPCTNTLKCGHPCLSLCGEPCEGQICRSCASDNQLDSCADFICQLSLRELGTGTDLDERTITLTCQHTFTVETLDGVTGIRNFYARDRSESSWTTALLPDLTGEILTRPVCPTCREPITSRRYGRIFKRTDLDILEHNVASTMSSKLFGAQTKLQANRENIENRVVTGIRTASEMKLIQRPMPSKNERESAIKKISAVLNPSRNQPTPPALFSEDLPAVHFIDEELANAWEYAIEPVLGAYNQACNLFDTRSSHSMAYEGSFAALYRDELEKSLSSLAVTYREPEQLAMRMARMRIGDAPPRTDKRFLVEAFWVTIEILLLFGRMAQRCSEILSSRATEKALWHDFAYFIFERAEADAQTALSMARDSESHRKVVSCTLLLLRAQEALARFRLKDKISAQEMTVDIKNDLLSEHSQIETLLKERVRQAVREYEAHFSLNGQSESGEWIRKNFHGPAKVVLESWEEVKGSIRLGTWYTTVSNDEKLSIVKAFSFGHSGHFYRCPNGHPYVITECGGAMQESRCPECNAPIGGGSHRLRSDNTHDTEFASLAHRQGSQANPWG